jgi:hypothetical protein
LFHSRGEAEQQPAVNLQIARAYPERFAQEALGHNSKAIHRAYSRRAQVELPPLSEFERMRTQFAELSKTIEPVMASA